MRFAVIMQHANIAYHVQRAYKILTQTNEIYIYIYMYILLLKYCNIRYVFFILCGNKDYYYYY